LTSRERVRVTLDHREPDRTPIDLGSTPATGICASSYSRLKKTLGIKSGLIKIEEPFEMIAEVEDEVRKILNVDTYGIPSPQTFFGFKNENWKPFSLFDGTEVMISGNMEYDVLENGDKVFYPQGDRGALPSAKMPKGGFYFDVIVRQETINESRLDPKDWVQQSFRLYSDEDLKYLEEKSKWLYENTDYSLVGNFWGAGFGDTAFVPGPQIKNPKGIRDPEEWYVSYKTRKQYIQEIFYYQFELQMENLKLYREAVGDRIDVIAMSGTDLGGQNGPLISPDIYRELFKPLHTAMNEWIQKNTNWKTFYHTCGSVIEFLDDFAEAGIDILNPVQISAYGMKPEFLKTNYGDKFVFWGGAVDPQKTLPFGTQDEVRKEVENNLRIFGKSGGYVFSNVHNIQDNISIENIVAMFEVAKGKNII
jgi:hypothetical protein